MTKITIPDEKLLKTDPSSYWKVLVDQFIETLDQKSKDNFILAANKFASEAPHLYIKDIPWFKDWFKQNKNSEK
uniref:Uncharacterized protein n=1 Tax=viral metagenome TaxID=1070528 RepID=A0A6C0E6X4_9ZZZZ